ncbi:MAG: preprotein translocase subunit SecE [Lachnospiraceae bacterium]|nr:preprotein translocase subunit SecE [Lachnospiraceae bacterium]
MGDSVEKKVETKPEAKPEKKTDKKKAKSSKLATFFKGVKSEFKKITWPDKHSTFKQSVAVVSISIVVGVIIAILDFVLQYGVNFLTSL